MARKVLGVAMMVDGVMQAMAVASLMSTIADRDLRDQSLFAAHLMVGAALIVSGRMLLSVNGRAKARPYAPAIAQNPHAEPREYVGLSFSSAVPVLALVAALVLSLIEATWFDWIGTAVRAAYTAIALAVLAQSTTLPITTPDSSR